MINAHKITPLINQALSDLKLPQVDFSLAHPANKAHGDFACNVALVLFPQLKGEGIDTYASPRTLAEAIVKSLNSAISHQPSAIIDSVEVAGPGFLNFTLSPHSLIAQTQTIITDQWPKPLKNQKICVEYTDPNPFKEFHIGHLYSNIIGESIARLFEANGAIVRRCDFYGDVGLHIAKSVWGLLQIISQDRLTLDAMEQLPLKERQQLLGRGYALGVTQYDQDDTVKETIKDINYLIYVISQKQLVKTKKVKPLVNYDQYIQGHRELLPQIESVYLSGLSWSLAYFETYYQRLGTHFNGYYPESWVGEIGLKLVNQALKKGILVLGDNGAVIYRGEKAGLHTRVFRNHLGLPTYEAKDLGLVQAKYQDFPFDRSLNIFGQEIDEYYRVVKQVINRVLPEIGPKQSHLAHGMVNLPSGKMSSRSGNVVTVEWLLNQAAKLSRQLIKNPKLSEIQKDAVAEAVGQAAVKYSLLQSHIGDNVTFDFDRSVTFNGNSGPYLQYTHARCRSVLSKTDINLNNFNFSHQSSVICNPEETSLLRWLTRYPETVNQAAADLAPHLICTYLYQLAQKYNTFYNRHTILGSAIKPSNHQTIQFRLFLTLATAQILKSGLSLLGISAPDQM